MVKTFPNQKFVLDHIAKPRISEPLSKTWVNDIINLSKQNNVFCKISGLVTETKDYNFLEADFLPFLDIIFQYFEFYFLTKVKLAKSKTFEYYDYFLKRINDTKKFNLDEESLFMEFEDRILNG